jgi:hypothetical protein
MSCRTRRGETPINDATSATPTSYKPGRAIVEAVNGLIKDPGKESAGTKGRIKLRGRTRYTSCTRSS